MPQLDVDNLGEIGIIKDIPRHRLPANAWTDGNQVRFTLGGVKQVNSQRPVLSTDAKTLIHWLYQFPPSGTPKWVYSTTESSQGAGDAKIWLEKSPPHTDLTRAAGDYNSIIAERPHGGVFQGLGYWNNVEDVPQLWAMGAVDVFYDMPNWSTHPEGANLRAKSVRPYKEFLMMGNLEDPSTEYPFRIRWSHPAQPGAAPTSFDVNDPATLANQFDLAQTSDHIIDGLTLGEIFVVYKETSTWGVQFVGGTDVMRRWKLFDDSGILWRDCMATYPWGHFVVTQTDIIVHNGTRGSEKSILQDKTRTWLFSILNTLEYKNSFCVTVAARKEVWFFFPTGTSTYANTVLMWSWADNTLGIRSLPNNDVPFAAVGLDTSGGEDLIWG